MRGGLGGKDRNFSAHCIGRCRQPDGLGTPAHAAEHGYCRFERSTNFRIDCLEGIVFGDADAQPLGRLVQCGWIVRPVAAD